MSCTPPADRPLRFNPPPNWPAPPQGWAPPPGWMPDPSWPPPPEGWQLWIPEPVNSDAISEDLPESDGLLEALPDRLEAELQKVLSPGESVLLKIKGAFKEGLVCTDRRVIIFKSGFMTGQTFGNNTYQEPYGNIAGVQVTFHLMSGYFELNAGGMQNTRKSYWSSDRRSDPAKAPNCVSLNNKKHAEKFRNACTFILAKAEQSRRGATDSREPRATGIPEQIRQLAELRDQDILSPEEFEAKKRDLLSRI